MFKQLSDGSVDSVQFVQAAGPVHFVNVQPNGVVAQAEPEEPEAPDAGQEQAAQVNPVVPAGQFLALEQEANAAPEAPDAHIIAVEHDENVAPEHVEVDNQLALVPFIPTIIPDVQQEEHDFKLLLPNPITAWMEYYAKHQFSIMFANQERNPALPWKDAVLGGETHLSEPSSVAQVVSAEKMNKKRGRASKGSALVITEVRHSTRSAVKKMGFKLVPMQDKPEQRKKPRSAKPREQEGSSASTSAPVETPISVLQKAGKLLEIPDAELTEERLNAAPSKPTSPIPSDD